MHTTAPMVRGKRPGLIILKTPQLAECNVADTTHDLGLLPLTMGVADMKLLVMTIWDWFLEMLYSTSESGIAAAGGTAMNCLVSQ